MRGGEQRNQEIAKAGQTAIGGARWHLSIPSPHALRCGRTVGGLVGLRGLQRALAAQNDQCSKSASYPSRSSQAMVGITLKHASASSRRPSRSSMSSNRSFMRSRNVTSEIA